MAAVEFPSLRLRLQFYDEWGDVAVAGPTWTTENTVIDLTAAIYDFNLAYGIAVLRSLDQYADYTLGNFFQLGRNRPVRRGHQLHVKRLTHESPLDLLSVIPSEVLYAAGTVGSLAFLAKLRAIALCRLHN